MANDQGSAKKGRRYRPWEREAIMAKFAKLRAKGMTADEAARKAGVPYITLRAWAKKDGKPLPGGPAKRGREPGRKPGRKPGRPKGKSMAKKAKKPGRPNGKGAGKARVTGRKPGRPRGRPRTKPVGRPRGRPRKERAVAERPAGGLVLVSPSGFRLEGIREADLLKVLRALG